MERYKNGFLAFYSYNSEVKTKQMIAMIRNIFILKDNGICVYYLPLSNISTNHTTEIDVNYSQLVSGFFTAIDTFAQSVAGYNQYLKSITLREINFYFYREKSFSYVLETDNINHNMDLEDYTSILEDISNVFEERSQSFDNDEDITEIIKDEELNDEINTRISRAIRRSLLKNTETSQSA